MPCLERFLTIRDCTPPQILTCCAVAAITVFCFCRRILIFDCKVVLIFAYVLKSGRYVRSSELFRRISGSSVTEQRTLAKIQSRFTVIVLLATSVASYGGARSSFEMKVLYLFSYSTKLHAYRTFVSNDPLRWSNHDPKLY